MAYCYFNGKIMPESEAGVSIRDVGVLRGYGVFDLLRTYGGRPFLFDEHFGRLVRSAAALGLEVPVSRQQAFTIVKKLLLKNKLPESTVRFVLTGGKAADSVHFNRATPTFFILISPFYELPASAHAKGAALETREHKREFPEVKSLNYLTAVKANNPLKGKAPFEILYTWQGRVLEAATSNFFMFSGDTLVTPARDVLIGTTRNLVIKLAKKEFKLKERDVSVRELFAGTEAFLTATNKDIVPVVSVNGKKIGGGKVGERTKRLMNAFCYFVDAWRADTA
ncbi:aminotransferase class IV [Candidatus Azambacteria bacterium]|nr:aminotransferase class IV [Candidatus Azambacteria bacterium]